MTKEKVLPLEPPRGRYNAMKISQTFVTSHLDHETKEGTIINTGHVYNQRGGIN